MSNACLLACILASQKAVAAAAAVKDEDFVQRTIAGPLP